MIKYSIMIYKTKDIIDVLEKLKLCKDVKGIIKEYLFGKCDECKEYKKNNSLCITFNLNNVCDNCISKFNYRFCGNCEKYYKILETKFCTCCNDYCKFYCINCYNNDDSMRFVIDV